jgi:hypothetical protein
MVKRMLIAVVLALNSLACTPAEAQLVTRTALDFADVACITANADLPDVDAVVKACRVEPALTSLVKAVLEDFRAKSAAYVAKRCGSRSP